MSGHSALLRASSQDRNGNLALRNITTEDGMGTGVQHGDTLVRFVDATLAADDGALAVARQAVIDAAGIRGLVDAAGVIGTFTMQNRVADATGLPLDAPLEMATRNLRAELGVDGFSAAAYTDSGGWLLALLARIAEPLMPLLLKLASRFRP